MKKNIVSSSLFFLSSQFITMYPLTLPPLFSAITHKQLSDWKGSTHLDPEATFGLKNHALIAFLTLMKM